MHLDYAVCDAVSDVTVCNGLQERSSWRASELCKLMDLPSAKLRMAAIFWINQGHHCLLLLVSVTHWVQDHCMKHESGLMAQHISTHSTQPDAAFVPQPVGRGADS